MRSMMALALGAAGAAALMAPPYSRPPMAWNSWFALQTHINATNLIASMQALVDLGLRDAGYAYANIDGGWEGGRLANGSIFPNMTAFPQGLEPVAAAARSLGLGFGMYTDKGPGTCDGRTGSGGHYAQDAAYYAHLGASYVKVDSCGGTQDHDGAMDLYAAFGEALASAYAAVGLPMPFYSLCGWYAFYAASAFSRGVGNSWRIGPDALSWQNVLINVDTAANTGAFTGRGQYNDVDEIGPNISPAQQASQMNLIAIIGSPLLLSVDLLHAAPGSLDWAMAPEVIAVHQDDAPTGPRYARVAGGPLAARLLSPLTHLPCDASDPRVVWATAQSPARPGWRTVSPSGSAAWSLHANHAWSDDYCSHNEQAWLAPSANATCCDEACSNQLFTFSHSDGTIANRIFNSSISHFPGPFLTVDAVPNTLFFNQRFNASDARAAAQTFSLINVTADADIVMLSSRVDGTCIGAPARLPDTTNVWARRLADGSAAFLFLNNGAEAMSIGCNEACLMAGGGFAASAVLHVRDIRARVDAGTVAVAEGYAVTVPPGGASAMFRMTPSTARAP